LGSPGQTEEIGVLPLQLLQGFFELAVINHGKP
jgi:hypothetical protein